MRHFSGAGAGSSRSPGHPVSSTYRRTSPERATPEECKDGQMLELQLERIPFMPKGGVCSKGSMMENLSVSDRPRDLKVETHIQSAPHLGRKSCRGKTVPKYGSQLAAYKLCSTADCHDIHICARAIA